MSIKSNFYKELLENGYSDGQEKTASAVKNSLIDTLSGYSEDQLEALAEEMGYAYEKMAGDDGNVIGTQADKKEEEDKEDAKSQQLAASSNSGEATKDERNATGSEASVESKTKAEVENLVNDNAKEHEETISKEAAIDLAYEVAGEKLASCNFSLADYVFTKVASEEDAIHIAATAEKLAFVSNKNPLRVADDLIGEIANQMYS